MKNTLLVLAELCALALIGQAQITYYVAVNGSDSNPGTKARPLGTIQKCADEMLPGDTCIVGDGTYTYPNLRTMCGPSAVVCLTTGGRPGHLVTFKSRHKWGAKIDGENNRRSTGFKFWTNAQYIRVEGFEIFGIGADASSSAFDLWKGGANSQIIGNNTHDIGRVCADTSNGLTALIVKQPNVVIDGNLIHDIGRYGPGENGCAPSNENWQNHDHGIYLDADEDVQPNNALIMNNVFYNISHGWAIHVYSSDFGRYDGIRILNNTFDSRNPNRDGAIIVNADTGFTNCEIENNISNNPRTSFLHLEPNKYSGCIVANNLTNTKAITDFSPPGVTFSNNVSGIDPMFADESARDYHLRRKSPAIGSGADLYPCVPADFDGNARPRGKPYDIGAFERVRHLTLNSDHRHKSQVPSCRKIEDTNNRPCVTRTVGLR